MTERRTIKYHLDEIPPCNTISRTHTHTGVPVCRQALLIYESLLAILFTITRKGKMNPSFRVFIPR